MENKYYTPELSELFIGMEVQIKSTQTSKDWSDSFNWYQENFWDLSNGSIQVRVKYLDSEDIESLGWYSNHKDFYHFICKEVTYTLNVLSNNFGNNKIEIRCASNPSLNYSNYLGECKNKSELIKLMKQLNIK